MEGAGDVELEEGAVEEGAVGESFDVGDSFNCGVAPVKTGGGGGGWPNGGGGGPIGRGIFLRLSRV